MLAALVVGMTVVSGLLLVLEPGPMAPLAGVTMMSTDAAQGPEDRLFDFPQEKQRPWQSIVIHDSGDAMGDAESLNQLHATVGKGGLAHHFVINNGSIQTDGLIEIGYRWQKQQGGAYLDRRAARSQEDLDQINWFHENGIGICMVGNADEKSFSEAQMRELVWLVRQLQDRFDVPREAVFVQVGSGEADVVPLFADASFKQQLSD